MKSNWIRVFILGLFLIGLKGFYSESYALTLGYPDISFDSSQGAGQDLFDAPGFAGVTFDPTTGYLSVSAKALSVNLTGAGGTPLIGGTVDYRVSLIGTSSDASTVTGMFGTSGGIPADLVVKDASSTLLTGTFISFVLNGFTMSPFNNIGAGVATFSVNGGTLAGDFGPTGGMVNLDFNVTPGFTSTSFTQGFTGSVKGDIAPVVPVPSTFLLLGSGLVLFGLLKTADQNTRLIT